MVLSMWSMRAAENSSASPAAPNSAAAPDRMRLRSASACGEPPGSRVSDDVEPEADQALRELAGLHRLARPLPAFEGYEAAARRPSVLAEKTPDPALGEFERSVQRSARQRPDGDRRLGLQRNIER